MADDPPAPRTSAHTSDSPARPPAPEPPPGKLPREIGGPAGPEPTRYGDWEHKGRCIDF
jgi:hypothetical protein